MRNSLKMNSNVSMGEKAVIKMKRTSLVSSL